jgi:NTE family protein
MPNVGSEPEGLMRGDRDPAWERFIAGGSIYSALDTPIGPIYFGLGLAEGGEGTVFFRLGQPFEHTPISINGIIGKTIN